MTKTFNCKVSYGVCVNGTKALDGLATLVKNNGKIAIDSVFFSGTTKEGKAYTVMHSVCHIDNFTREIYDFKRNEMYPDLFVYTYKVINETDENGVPTAWQHITICIDTTKPVVIKDENEIQF